jgi:hypothetical protein
VSSLGNRVLALVVSIFVALAVFLVPSAQAAGTGTISGTVTAAEGAAMKLDTTAQVQVLDGGTWKVVESYRTRYTYTSAPLAPGTYRVEFSNMDFATQVSAPVYVAADAAVTVDAVMDPGATIQGRFTIPAGGPVPDGFVHVYQRSSTGYWVPVDNGFVDPNGTYYVGGLAGGAYKVGFIDFKSNYKPEFFDNVATLDQAAVLNIAAGADATGIDVTLSTEQLPIPAPTPTPTPTPVLTHVTIDGQPRITGTPRVGQKVRAKLRALTPSSAKVRYIWAIDGRRIKNATKRSLLLKAPMKGHILSLKIVATSPGLTSFRGRARSKFVRPAR